MPLSRKQREKERLAQIKTLLEHFRKVLHDTNRMIASLESERDRGPRATPGRKKG